MPPNSWGPVQNNPPGFLSALGLKNVGRNPGFLSDTYVPVIDMMEWLLAQDRETILFQRDEAVGVGTTAQAFLDWGNVPSPGDGVVPDGEAWFVWNYSAYALLGSADIIVGSFKTAYQRVDAAGEFGWLGSSTSYCITGGPLGVPATFGAHSDPRRWFTAGYRFGVGWDSISIAADPASVLGCMEVTRVRV